MTKKDFIELANLSRMLEGRWRKEDGTYIPGIQAVLNDYKLALADFCQEQNPRFNRAKWLAYIAEKP